MEEGKSNRVGQGKRIDHFLSNDPPKLSVFSTRVDRPNSRDARDNREELSVSRYQNSKSPWKSQDSTNTTDPIILVLNGWSVDIYAYLFCRKSHWRIRKWSDIKYEITPFQMKMILFGFSYTSICWRILNWGSCLIWVRNAGSLRLLPCSWCSSSLSVHLWWVGFLLIFMTTVLFARQSDKKFNTLTASHSIGILSLISAG